ncbi:hypothetical protein BJX70DRAFT_407619 [Aspergillus crustosus]
MDYKRCAALHNELLYRSWTGAGNAWTQVPTWWETYSPPAELAQRLHPSLVEFLKLIYHIQAFTTTPEQNWRGIFYFVRSVLSMEYMLAGPRLGGADTPDRFLELYVSTGYMMGDEDGIIFDQHTLKATYVAHTDDSADICMHKWGWMPLETILGAYIQMADEGKVSVTKQRACHMEDAEGNNLPIEVPWLIHRYTKREASQAAYSLPWHDLGLSNPELIPRHSFSYEFLSATSAWKARFRYIAPGIRFPTIAEFLDQPHPPGDYPGDCSLRIFQIDHEEESHDQEKQQLQQADDNSPEDDHKGLFISSVTNEDYCYFTNGCELSLPFAIGSNGWARMSNGEPFGIRYGEVDPKPTDTSWQIYQSGTFNGFVNDRSLQIHKVLENWAERVGSGDWDVGEDGVRGGVERFWEADTEEHWRKYWIPPSW